MISSFSYIKGAVTAFTLFIVSDMLWHTVLLGNFYTERLQYINGTHMDASFPFSILLFECIAALGCTYFVLRLSNNITEAVKNGAILGLMLGSAINFVNHGLILTWDSTLMLVDTGWAIVTGLLVGAATFAVAGRNA
jgi:uncharacterized membrane protein